MIWRWTKSEQLSFKLTQIECATRVSMHGVDWTIDIHFYTDASGFGGGLVVTQFQQIGGSTMEVPIIYNAVTFSLTKRCYVTYKREVCVMVKFASKYHYLLRDPTRQAIIHTDHKPLVHFLESSMHDRTYGHWVAKLQELNIKIVHIKGKRNKVTDELSQTIFFQENCFNNEVIQDIVLRLSREGFQ